MSKIPLKNKRYNKGWDNLKPCKPGETHNPNGRPKKGTAIADCMREYLAGEIDTEGGKITRQQALVKAIFQKAMKGGDAAQRLMMNYVDGMPIQTIKNVDIVEDDINLDKLSNMDIQKLREIEEKLYSDE